MVVLMIMGITLAVVATTFNRYLDRSSAKRAAEVFGQDLTAARNMAARSRQTVVVDFDEGNRSYLVRVMDGDTILYRFFDNDSDITLGSMNLQLTGDSVAFDSQGFADLSGASGSLGWALFVAGSTTYAVRFNSMGSSRIDEQ
jgi:type II secretory pathway pseudopilin PulG